MKSIEQLTLVSANGLPIRDIAKDTIALEYMKLADTDKPLPMEAYPILQTDYLIKRMIDLASYKSRSEQRTADGIYAKIIVTKTPEGKEVILLEDGELDFLNKIRDKFTPYLSGRIFEPFHKAMENATTISQ